VAASSVSSVACKCENVDLKWNDAETRSFSVEGPSAGGPGGKPGMYVSFIQVGARDIGCKPFVPH
jgi:hypothetical protein